MRLAKGRIDQPRRHNGASQRPIVQEERGSSARTQLGSTVNGLQDAKSQV